MILKVVLMITHVIFIRFSFFLARLDGQNRHQIYIIFYDITFSAINYFFDKDEVYIFIFQLLALFYVLY